MSVAERFAQNLVSARKRVGISQEEVAWRASLHRTQLGELERGKRQPRIDTVVKLCGALGVTPNDLLAGIVWRPAQTESRRFLDG